MVGTVSLPGTYTVAVPLRLVKFLPEVVNGDTVVVVRNRPGLRACRDGARCATVSLPFYVGGTVRAVPVYRTVIHTGRISIECSCRGGSPCYQHSIRIAENGHLSYVDEDAALAAARNMWSNWLSSPDAECRIDVDVERWAVVTHELRLPHAYVVRICATDSLECRWLDFTPYGEGWMIFSVENGEAVPSSRKPQYVAMAIEHSAPGVFNPKFGIVEPLVDAEIAWFGPLAWINYKQLHRFGKAVEAVATLLAPHGSQVTICVNDIVPDGERIWYCTLYRMDVPPRPVDRKTIHGKPAPLE